MKKFFCCALCAPALPVRIFLRGAGGCRGVSGDGYDENMPILHLVQKDGRTHLVTAAWTDLQNPGVGSNPSDYVFQETGLEAGVYKDYTFYMMPTVYTLAEGHHLELCLLTWDPYRAFLDENESPEPAEGPKLADYNYSFDIDLDSLKVQLPVVP